MNQNTLDFFRTSDLEAQRVQEEAARAARKAAQTVTAPVGFAAFTVTVRADSENDARRVVERYLYAGGEVTQIALDDSDFDRPQYGVQVVVTALGGNLDGLRYRVEYQRDRLASGMYGSTTPVYYAPTSL